MDYHVLSLPRPIFDMLPVDRMVQILGKFCHSVLSYNRSKDANLWSVETPAKPIIDGVTRVTVSWAFHRRNNLQ